MKNVKFDFTIDTGKKRPRCFDDSKSSTFIPGHLEKQFNMQFHYVILDIVMGELH